MADNNSGKWPEGTSGNLRGRPRKKELELLSTPEDLAAVILRVANRQTTVKVDGRNVVMSVFEANTMGMATGTGPARLARKAFIDLATNASFRLERQKKRVK